MPSGTIGLLKVHTKATVFLTTPIRDKQGFFFALK